MSGDRQSKPPDLEQSDPAKARLEQSKTGRLSQVRPGQSKPPDLKQSKPLQARLEQTRTGKLRSGQASLNHLTSNNLSPLEAIMITETVLFWKANLKTMENSFQFRNSDNGASDQLMSGLCRWVNIMKEGNPALYFEMAEQQPTKSTPFQEPTIKWKNSVARKLLHKDMQDGIVPLEPGGLTLKELYVMHPEYAEYAYQKFSSGVLSLWKSIKKNVSRAEEDKAMRNGKALNPATVTKRLSGTTSEPDEENALMAV
eukprot:jgi/Psemu1/19273/gm1.19273_g